MQENEQILRKRYYLKRYSCDLYEMKNKVNNFISKKKTINEIRSYFWLSYF